MDLCDDAGVYQLDAQTALIQTVDYFTPVVDDAYDFGRIAAANALSDVYAMGGRPLTALNLVGFPVGKLPLGLLAEILRGGMEKVEEAGAVLVGGHTIDDSEPKYGLAVTGVVEPDGFWTKGGARPGDRLILTKPIGVGVITTALKRTEVSAAIVADAVRVMATLNDGARDAGREVGINACTDVTGFGLLGHAQEMARAGGVGIRLYADQVPLLPGAREFAAQDLFPGGTRANASHFGQFVVEEGEFTPGERLLFYDAVTSGGLLMAVSQDRAERLVARLVELGTPAAAVVGEVLEAGAGSIRLAR